MAVEQNDGLDAIHLNRYVAWCARPRPHPRAVVLYRSLGPAALMWLAVGVFVVAWVAQFVGHKIEGKKPSFLTDLAYLLIGPAWIVAKIMRRLHIAY